jgi:D-3-phosphoglycerate dehydrogenase / 2-oxoglutarate reductase
MSTRILVAGDHFILPSIFADAIRAEVKTAIEFREYQSPWPGVPFCRIGEVTEASGSEDEIIEALQGGERPWQTMLRSRRKYSKAPPT